MSRTYLISYSAGIPDLNRIFAGTFLLILNFCSYPSPDTLKKNFWHSLLFHSCYAIKYNLSVLKIFSLT